jgi:anti-sigma regulatory factor (Ser/Thr protein kinase)
VSSTTRTAQRAGYRHEALLWDSTEAFLRRTVPFVGEAVRDGIPVMVALTEARVQPLRSALGPAADDVTFLDTTVLGRNPARLIPVWLAFVAEHPGVPLRGIGELSWAPRRPAELVECQIHEAVLNVAVPADTPLWLLCPYDTRMLDESVLDGARRHHPEVDQAGEPHVPHAYQGRDHRSLLTLPLEEPTGPVTELAFTTGELKTLRRAAAHHAAAAGLDAGRAGDLVLAISELGSNSIDHGGGSGLLRVWAEPDALVIEVHDAGHLEDPLAGRLTPTPRQARGRGLWMVNRLCDLVQIRRTAGGTVVRVTTWL